MTPTLRRLTAATALVLGLATAPTAAFAAGGYATPGPTPPPPGPGGLAIERPDLTVELDDAAEASGRIEARVRLSAPLAAALSTTVQVLFPEAGPHDLECPQVEPGVGCPWTIALDLPAGATVAPFSIGVVDDGVSPGPARRIGVEVAHVWPAGRVDVGPGDEAWVFDGTGFTVSIPDEVQAWEGDTGDGRALDVVVSASAPAPEDVTVHVFTAVVGGSAEAGVDYTPVEVAAVVPAGASGVTVEVPIIGDEVDEANELLLVFVESPSLGTVAFDGGTAVGRILDDDGPGEGPGRPSGPGGYQSPSRSARSAARTA